SVCSLALGKVSENDTLLPVMNIKEVQTGYLAWPDKELSGVGVEGEEERRPSTTACTPRSELPAERRLEGALNTVEGEFNATSEHNETDSIEEKFEKIYFKLCDE
ncbi:hypothetical protein PFISCL1PPCAC_22046, partial [Pristionchus fissidentatus]